MIEMHPSGVKENPLQSVDLQSTRETTEPFDEQPTTDLVPSLNLFLPA